MKRSGTKGIQTTQASAAGPLTAEEANSLRQCEDTIERGEKTFIEVGQALATIRDRKLHRDTHDTFEAYCRARWGIGRNYANKQIAAAAFVRRLGTGVPKPANEAQVRPLLQFRAEDQPRVWDTLTTRLWAHGDSQLTASAYEIQRAIKNELLTAKEGPFKTRRLDIKREKKERKAEAKNKHHVPPPFDVANELVTLRQTVAWRRQQWPTEHRQALADALRAMADEVLAPTTCPKCGTHEVDADGDCVECHEPPTGDYDEPATQPDADAAPEEKEEEWTG